MEKILFTDYLGDLDIKCNGLLIHTLLSNSTINKINNNELNEIINKIHSKEMIALCMIDRLIGEDELDLMHEVIDLIIKESDYIIYSDYSVLFYIKNKYSEYLDKLIYNPKTLVCNIHEFNAIETSSIISNELTIDQIENINKYYEASDKYLGIKAFGFHPMFYSKRHLINAYNDYFNKNEIKANKFYDLEEENRTAKDKIIETDFGTLIYFGKPLIIYEELSRLDNFKFVYINSELFNLDTIKLVCDFYYDYLFMNNSHYNDLIKLVPNYSKGFLDRKTVLFKGDDDE